MFYVVLAVSAVAAYFIGSISFAIIVTRKKLGKDIRDFGSGNAGGTNTMRVLGKKYGVLVMFLDMLKAFISVSLARLLFFAFGFGTVGDLWLALVGVTAVFGHLFPVYYGFRGGKGIAATAGVVLAISPLTMIILFAIWCLIVALTRYVSLGSIVCGLLVPPGYYLIDQLLLGRQNEYLLWTLLALGVMTAMIVLSHWQNIKRLVKGKENKI